MAAATSTTSTNTARADVPQSQREFNATPLKKLCILFLSFTAAVGLLSTTIVIVAPILIATTHRFPSLSLQQQMSKIAGGGHPSHDEIIYVPPTQEDLDRIRQELEVSEILPAFDSGVDKSDNPRSASRIQSVIATTESQLQQLEREWNMVKKEIDELTGSYNSFLERWDQDTSRNVMSVDESATMQYFESRLTALRTILGGQRTSFMDLDRHDMTNLLTSAVDELHWLLNAEDESEDAHKTLLFLNSNNLLFNVLTNESAPTKNETNQTSCQSSYLDLNEGNPSSEFIPTAKPVKISTASHAITDETARESDLYFLVEEIKRKLVWEEDDESMSRPPFISDEELDNIRSNIAPMISSIENVRNSALDKERKVREYWVDRIETFVSELESSDDVGSNGAIDSNDALLCASTGLVGELMEAGLETFRRKGDLRSELEDVALRSVMEAPPEQAAILLSDLQKIEVPKIDYTSDETTSTRPATSSWKVGKNSIAYVVDGPWLLRGVVNWIDYFVDAISGYNGKLLSMLLVKPSMLIVYNSLCPCIADHVDSLFDWIVGDGPGSSVGSVFVASFSKLIRKIPLPESVGRMKRSGILAGRTRTLLES